MGAVNVKGATRTVPPVGDRRDWLLGMSGGSGFAVAGFSRRG